MDVSMVLNLQEDLDLNEQAEKATNVTSKAVIKYTEPTLPVPYRKLKQDTNLNSAPENWLKSNLAGRFYDGSIKKRKPIDLSSFTMARNYLDCVGEVDVISDAENIKRLLKTPYSDGSLSMVVHRIRNTLLINDFDVPKIMSAASQNPELSPKLDWLRRLYCEVMNIPQDSQFAKKKRNREHAKSQSILSKFLHYSIPDSPGSRETLPEKTYVDIVTPSHAETEVGSIKTIFDEPEYLSRAGEAQASNIETEPTFQRDVLWTLDDITMLVGSNMPIFGGGRFPAVSLRLRDASKPINILTGLDYWLDNLMCNVPELVMCYHLEGIVQRYEVVMTEDLPKLEGCKFSPKVVKGIAQDILSFLKSKCTKEGHTYWLFKGSKSDIVKLYDLTSICNEEASEESQNPFALPVASLLYRIARNMVSNGIRYRKDAAVASSLLQNCILLLEKEKRSEMILAANYLLASLYMQDYFPGEDSADVDSNLDEDSYGGDVSHETENGSTSSDDEKAADTSNCVGISSNPARQKKLMEAVGKSIRGPQRMLNKAWFDSNNEEKYRLVIKFVTEALKCNDVISPSAAYRRNPLSYPIKEDDNVESTNQNIRNVSDNVPMNIGTPLTSYGDVITPEGYTVAVQDGTGPSRLLDPWKNDWKTELNSHAVTAYTFLAEISIGKEKYSRALRLMKIALLCLDSMPSKRSDALLRTHAKLAMMTGDICLIFAHKRKPNFEEFITLSDDDASFVKQCSMENPEASMDTQSLDVAKNIDKIFNSTSEELMIKAVLWYEESLNVSPSNASDNKNVDQIYAVTARLGNVRNELGVYYMNSAFAVNKGFGNPSQEEQNLWKKSFQYFEKGIQAFQVINDRQNIALLYSNSARLMRLCAQVYGNGTKQAETENRGEFNQLERLYFNKAFEFYQKALSNLSSRDRAPEIWDRISFDLSGAYFSMGSLLQDNAPLSTVSYEEVSTEVQNLLMKSLHYCDEESSDTSSSIFTDTRSRIGKIHHRIASLYQYYLRQKSGDAGSKKYKSLAELHYNKAYPYLQEERCIMEYITTLTEHVALYTQLSTHITSPFKNIKRLRSALLLISREKNSEVLRNAAVCVKNARGRIQNEEIQPKSLKLQEGEKTQLQNDTERLYGKRRELREATDDECKFDADCKDLLMRSEKFERDKPKQWDECTKDCKTDNVNNLKTMQTSRAGAITDDDISIKSRSTGVAPTCQQNSEGSCQNFEQSDDCDEGKQVKNSDLKNFVGKEILLGNEATEVAYSNSTKQRESDDERECVCQVSFQVEIDLQEIFGCSLETMFKMVELLDLQLSGILKELVLLFTIKNSKVKIVERLDAAAVKKMFEIYLRGSIHKSNEKDIYKDLPASCEELADIIEKIREHKALNGDS